MRALLLAVLLLTGCATSGSVRVVESGCASASAALKVLTAANDAGKLSPETQRQVLSAAGHVTPICTAPTPPTLDTLEQKAFARAVALLAALARDQP